MTDTAETTRSRRETDRPLADAAARLLDRLRTERLPVDERQAAALRKATRNAFLLVEETRRLTAAKAQIPAIPDSAAREKFKLDRPFFLVLDGKRDDRDDPADADREAFHERADRAHLRDRKCA